MSFSNLEYLYAHLPARMRRDDADFFLWRFLHWFGEQVDAWDEQLDTFYQQLAPETATEEFIEWWLWSLFGWAWFPSWYTLEQKRNFYAHVALHYARRGTRRGIEEFLRAFGIHARVFNKPSCWGELAWGDTGWVLPEPLGLVVQITRVDDLVNFDVQCWGEAVCGESPVTTSTRVLTLREIESLLRFQWPNGQELMIHYVRHPSATPDS